MAKYLEYLRKSRMDTDYEETSVEETLSRHRQILEKFCKDKKLNVVEVLEEVVSGESQPTQQLLPFYYGYVRFLKKHSNPLTDQNKKT